MPLQLRTDEAIQKMTAIQLSNRLLIAVTTLSDYRPYVAALANLSRKQLRIDLCTLPARKAFLINIYNAFAQVLIREQHPDLTAYITRYKFFSRTAILIAGENLSLNDIEHGLLRHTSVWWSFGYLKKIFKSEFEKSMRVPLDYRIHFA